MSHSPGPWHVETSEGDGRSLAICKAGVGVLALINPEEGPDETDRANAALMAAAPKYLEDLEQIARFTYDGEKDEDGQEYEMSIDDAFDTAHGAITIARAAIAKIKEG